MDQIKYSIHFVLLNRVPCFSVQTSINDVFKYLEKWNKGGFLVQSVVGPTMFVKAEILAKLALNLVIEKGELWLRGKMLSDFLKVADVQTGIVIIGPNVDSISKDENLPTLDDKSQGIFPVQENERQIGWLFAQLDLLDCLEKPSPQFICHNGHENPDLGDGSCYFCPGIFEKVET